MVVALASLLLAACATSDGDVAETTSVVSTVPSATDAPTTVPSTDAPPTTAAPTTTIDPAEDLAAQVEADLLEADRLANEALQDPFDAEMEAAALERRTGFLENLLRETLAEYRRLNRALRPNPDVPATVEVEVPAELVLEGGDVAELQVCEVNSWILVEVGAGPSGSDAIVDPNVVAFRTLALMRNVDGTWLVEGGTILGQWEEATECPGD